MIIFLLTAVFMARVLEKKRYHLALICHAIGFAILLLYMSFLPGVPTGALWERALGAYNAHQVETILFNSASGSGSVISVIILLESFTLLQTIPFAIAAVRKLTDMANKLKLLTSFAVTLDRSARKDDQDNECLIAERRYITFCRCNC